jgi:hypothetical protein
MSEYGFNEQGDPEPITSFDFDEVCRRLDGDSAAETSDETRLKEQTLVCTIAFLTDIGRTPVAVGQACILLAHLLRCEGAPKRQKDLATLFKVSEPRISARVKWFRKKLAQIVPD